MLERYKKYLELIDDKLLKKYFEQQKPYLHCKEGCSFCCKAGQYPFSLLELQYLMVGYNELTEQEKDIIQTKIKKVRKEEESSSAETFLYECPFLINDKCSLYQYRGIICRTHGLLFFVTDKEGNSRNKIPNCVNFGLNYSNVYDKETKMISQELWEKSGIKAEPVGYNISLKALMKNCLTEELELEFGEVKALIDWFD